MQVIPLRPVPAQVVSVTLGQQICRIAVYQKSTGLFLDLWLNDELICAGVTCLDRNRIVRAPYKGFVGELAFVDTQGATTPDYSGIGTRYFLMWLDAAELAGLAPASEDAAA